MGFLYHAIKFPAITLISFFLNTLSQLKWLIIKALTHLGLYKSPPPDQEDDSSTPDNFIFILDGTSPSLVPIPIHVVTAAIKNKVPVIPYQDFVKRAAQVQITQDNKVCTICFEGLEAMDEVRDLSRCSHVFHRYCLDGWVDSGRVTCPLCRSMLLPPKTNLSRCGLDPPKMEEIGGSIPPSRSITTS